MLLSLLLFSSFHFTINKIYATIFHKHSGCSSSPMYNNNTIIIIIIPIIIIIVPIIIVVFGPPFTTTAFGPGDHVVTCPPPQFLNESTCVIK